MSDQEIDRTTDGLLIESHRAYLGWRSTLETRNRAADAELAARRAYLRLAHATAERLSAALGHRVDPVGEELKQATERAWTAHVAAPTTRPPSERAASESTCTHPRLLEEETGSGEAYRIVCGDCGAALGTAEYPR